MPPTRFRQRSRQRCLVLVVLALLGVVVPAGDDAGAAASAFTCRTEPNLRGVSVFVGNVVEGAALELVVDDVVIDRAVALGAGVETVLFAPAEDAAAHRFVVTVDEGPTIECGSASVASFPRTTVSCTIDRVVDGAPYVVHDSPYVGMVLTRDGSVLAAREISNGFVDLSARPSTRYRYSVRFVGPGSVVDVPCGAVTTPARTVAQRVATTR